MSSGHKTCRNCDDRKCMDCVLRIVHQDCRDDCPFCCPDEPPRYFVTVQDGGPQRQWTYAKYEDAVERAWEEHDKDGSFVLVSRHDGNGAMTLSTFGPESSS